LTRPGVIANFKHRASSRTVPGVRALRVAPAGTAGSREKGIIGSRMDYSEREICSIFQDPVREGLDAVEEKLRDVLGSDMPLIDEICGYINLTPGKRLRPNILLLASKSVGGDGESAVTGGMAVELIHTATLIHDDIIDGHATRRGRETIYSKWGRNVATIMGDFLYSKAFECLGEAGLDGIMKILARTTNVMSVGEMMQFQLARNIEVSEDRYMNMIFSKTASLFSASGECGAITAAGGKSNGSRERYSLFGTNLGLAFQITDDLFDYIAADDRIGKPVASDFADGRVTLPFITAFRNAPDPDKSRVRELFHSGFSGRDEWGEVVSFVQNFGGIEYSLNKARQLGETAKDTLLSARPSRERDALCHAADYVIRRVDPFSS